MDWPRLLVGDTCGWRACSVGPGEVCQSLGLKGAQDVPAECESHLGYSSRPGVAAEPSPLVMGTVMGTVFTPMCEPRPPGGGADGKCQDAPPGEEAGTLSP